MAKVDPNIVAHLEWIGFVKPTGLVVSPPTLVRAGAILNRYDRDGQRLLRECVEERAFGPEVSKVEPYLPSFRIFAETVLDWSFSPKAFAGTEEYPIPDELKVQLPTSNTIIQPHYAIRERDSIRNPTDYDGAKWQLLVRMVNMGEDLDRVARTGSGIDASPHGMLERLLRETGVTAGLLFNGTTLRLVSAPRRESSGWLDFRVSDMVQTAGRPISSALRLILNQPRLLTLPSQQRLTALLVNSRKFQNEVSESLAEQVLQALYELLRGFQAAHDASKGELLRIPLRDRPDDVYRALLTVILRIVFLLYAEERDILPHGDETFSRYYSIAGLYERLREDVAQYPDTMSQRFGAWSQLSVLFRMFHAGAQSGEMRLISRRGSLFDPERFPFLERLAYDPMQNPESSEVPLVPLVPDGTIYRVLEKLLVLRGERISYRALDVEHIGSVYETMVGFKLEPANGLSIAIRSTKKHGAPSMINLEALLAEPSSLRQKWIRIRTDRNLTPRTSYAVRCACTLDAIHAALDPVIDKSATPDIVHSGAMVLQPSPERRRSGSHYTPRELTQPIVKRTIEPVLERLRAESDGPPTPAQILDLKICDPAVGSGAFLVEACRQLAEFLVDSWSVHGEIPRVLTDEEEIILARRRIAQKCLYGVDRNRVAVDLTKISLWLVTLSKEHPLTFVDHAIRHGDSLVGLSLTQIKTFHWARDQSTAQQGLESMRILEHTEQFALLRRRIRNATEHVSDDHVHRDWKDAHRSLNAITYFGDLIVTAFFEGDTPKARESIRTEFATSVAENAFYDHESRVVCLQSSDRPLVQFHWDVEFPEVFERLRPGFDIIIGNPPFAGKNTLAAGNPSRYPSWLKNLHPESHGNGDLVAHFFRRSFNLLRRNGTLGLIATNTISQGDTRFTGLRWICTHEGHIYDARSRFTWPGLAAVVVSVIHIMKGSYTGCRQLDGKIVDQITAFLFDKGSSENPKVLRANKNKSFQGSVVLGAGFTFDDRSRDGSSSPLSTMSKLINGDKRNQELIFPYIGGRELNTSPGVKHHRYVINFFNYPLIRADIGLYWRDLDALEQRKIIRTGIVPNDYPEPVAFDWPDLISVIFEKVYPERSQLKRTGIGRTRAKFWWHYGAAAHNLYDAIKGLNRVLAMAQVNQHFGFAFLPAHMVFSCKLYIFPFDTYAAFCTLQSRVHETWARFFSSSLKDHLSYANTDCFETFPFPHDWRHLHVLESLGQEYYTHRSHLMLQHDEGLTKTYNRFHDPNEYDPGIELLRGLHESMDRAVLDAYGWTDISTKCEFLLDYEIEGGGGGKKPYRYRWPDHVRDEVLGRLLELNAQRAAEEERTRLASKKEGRSKVATRNTPTTAGGLFPG